MFINEDVLTKRILPAIKTHIINTRDVNMRKTELARRLGLTPAALEKYRGKSVTDYIYPETWNEIEEDVRRIVRYIYSPNFDFIEFSKVILTYWIKWNSKGIMCREIARDKMRYVGLFDEETLCRRIIEIYGEMLLNTALVEVQNAYGIFTKIPNIHHYIPEVSTNIVRLVEIGRKIEDYPVIGFPGRIVCIRNRVMVHSPPRVGGSRHMGNVLRRLYEMDYTTKGMTGVKYDEELILRFRRMGYSVERYRVKNDEELIRRIRKASDIVVDEGGLGREGFIYVSGYNSVDAVKKLEEILIRI